MTKTKIWLIIASVLITVGLISFVLLMSLCGWDFGKLNTVRYVTSEHTVTEKFNSISVEGDTADIAFLPSEDGACRVSCYDHEKIKYTATVDNGILKIECTDERAWYECIGFNLNTSRVTVYLPMAEYAELSVRQSTGDVEINEAFSFGNIDISLSTGDVRCYAKASEGIKISASTGSVTLASITAASVEISVSTGDVRISDTAVLGDISIGVSTGRTNMKSVTARSVISSGSTGNITLEGVIAKEKISVTRSTGDVSFRGSDAGEISVKTDTGDVSFRGSDAGEIYVKTDTGDVIGTLLSEKIFVADSSTGDVDVPRSTFGGICEITTSTGDIRISIE